MAVDVYMALQLRSMEGRQPAGRDRYASELMLPCCPMGRTRTLSEAVGSSYHLPGAEPLEAAEAEELDARDSTEQCREGDWEIGVLKRKPETDLSQVHKGWGC
ncbi:hypothetical protein Vretimale_3648 [Volvox reticuliferus]|uniref:Uncharacterized protein n=1 Tax=Volvox reticuliferus TaxID=1737510 RepID=A0A8J4DAE4_9CHLO|nr:hypothetical protein Vretifemale_1251 [Volvox reticuliferus]GIL98239.1 hypothetical protein Vretimale_3648 [Volvox reticuliferus]